MPHYVTNVDRAPSGEYLSALPKSPLLVHDPAAFAQLARRQKPPQLSSSANSATTRRSPSPNPVMTVTHEGDEEKPKNSEDIYATMYTFLSPIGIPRLPPVPKQRLSVDSNVPSPLAVIETTATTTTTNQHQPLRLSDPGVSLGSMSLANAASLPSAAAALASPTKPAGRLGGSYMRMSPSKKDS